MPDSIQVTIINKLKALTSSDFSSGFSGANLSATGRVILGAPNGAPLIPSASIIYVDTIEQQGRTLGRYVGESVYQIVAYAGGSTLEKRITGALNLAADLQKALTQDRTLGLSGLTEDVLVNQTALDGEEYGISQAGIALLEVRVSHQTQFGV
tara:strand:+ start:1011 stop:1469 length:459 start_codon:yes stop_codon:yes gene_type:complete